MRVALTIAALAGCNQALGLDSTVLRDAPPPDAPYACTDEAPALRGKPIVVMEGDRAVRSYSISMDRQIAVGELAGSLVEGPGDAPLTASASLSPAPTLVPGSPRLSPEGDELFVRFFNPTGAGQNTTIAVYQRAGDLWERRAVILATNVLTGIPDLSAPTRRTAGARHLLVTFGLADLREIVETAPDTWAEVAAYTPGDLGVVEVRHPNLTSDGLHVVFEGRDAAGNLLLGYASRPSIDARFGMAIDMNPFFGKPVIVDPFLVEDCARLYFFVVAKPTGIFYVEPI